jgi:hypothetical protein
MTRLKTSLTLLALVSGAIIVSWVQLARDTRLPVGSSYSFQADGAQALYEWADALGAQPSRFQQATIDPSAAPRMLLVLQPESFLSDRDRRAFDTVARNGGTLVLAGDSLALQAYARSLDVTFEPAPVTSPQGLSFISRFRLRADDATPLLMSADGDWLALRKPHRQGTLIVIASPQPLTNGGLRDPETARFVLRELLQQPGIAFDEAHHSYSPPTESQPVTLNQLLFDTAPGRAIVYAAGLMFVFLLLAGRRLGPPIAERGAAHTRRTMYEHVQMLAGLYRRAGQLETVRAAFARHYQRVAAHGTLSPTRAAALSEAARQVQQAGSESALVTAVAAADAVVNPR